MTLDGLIYALQAYRLNMRGETPVIAIVEMDRQQQFDLEGVEIEHYVNGAFVALKLDWS